MLNRIALPLLFMGLLTTTLATAQVKIGDDPQNINATSLLELQSNDKVLVITRVDAAQMATIVPTRGALVYNTTENCVFYYDGSQWVNLCEGGAAAGNLTADPVIYEFPTIAISETTQGTHFEVLEGSINTDHIADNSINGLDIQNGSIGNSKLAPAAVNRENIFENAVDSVALDGDNINLSMFQNNLGFITNAQIVDPNVNNSIEIRTDGAFYDDPDDDATNEIQSLSLNGQILSLSGANSIVLPGANGTETNIISTTTTQVSGDGSLATPYQINVTGVDTAVDNELITNAVLNASNELVITEAGNNITVDLSSLDGGTGTTQNAAQVPVAATPTNYTAATADVEAHLAGIDAQLANGTGSHNTALNIANDSLNITDGNGTLSVSLAGIGNANTNFSVANDSLVISDNSGDLKVALSEIAAATGGSNNTAFAVVNDSLSITDGDGTLSVPIDSLAPRRTPKSILFADTDGTPTTTEDNTNPNDDFGLIWDTNARPVSSNTYGALYVGRQAGSPAPGNNSKVVISERIGPSHPQQGLSYPLQLQNENGTDTGGGAAGILFAVESLGSFGKGGLVYERTGPWGIGDFHFLQNQVGDNSIPALTDQAFTIKNNGDIQLYGNLIAQNGAGSPGNVLTINPSGATVWGTGGGIPTGGTADQVLLTDGTTPAWTTLNGTQVDLQNALDIDSDGTNETTIEEAIAKLNARTGSVPTGGTADQVLLTDGTTPGWTTLNGTQVDLQNALDIDSDGTNETTVEEAIGKLAAVSGGQNLGNTNLQQTASTDRKYDLNNGAIYFEGTGNVGIGNFDFDNLDNTIPNQAEDKFHVIGQIRAQRGFAANGGSNNEPSYSFFTNGDTDTGMFRATDDEIGFSTGGTEAIRIDDNQNVGIGENNPQEKLHVQGSIRIDNGNIIARNGVGTNGQILATTTTGTEWVNSEIAAKGKVLAGVKTVNFPDMGGTNYVVQTTVMDNGIPLPTMIQVTDQTATSITVEIYQFVPGSPDDPGTPGINESTPSDFQPVDLDWFYTIIRP
ncbi:hypothetical protein [Cytophaga sp. FL35]|uniref:beta strand repeat-containing protein n=1 Tax=Cytophaga sp. FL35 TaxID=1904456 RepID=UPI0016535ECF|nr:hypothetical protein [Cytophaga sp. FL35]MBC6999494.1 hypothetical protein [Cytophaga sp. FL35]